MHLTPLRLAATCTLLLAAISASAQTTGTSARKPGLWESTSTTTVQQSPMPAGMPAPANSPFAGGSHTTLVCLTQAMIDKYGAPAPSANSDCKVSDIVKTPTGMTASISCSGRITAKGTVEYTFLDATNSTSKVHITGTVQAGPRGERPVEWTTTSHSTFKSEDCGSVKPTEVAPK